MNHILSKRRNLQVLYAALLQIEYVLALVAGVLLGAERWLLFGVCLVLTCGLGLGTCWLYWVIMERLGGDKNAKLP